ncbi:MAG: GNAT family N-acetyltransferase [Bacteroidales bacterium]|nr:GNAT family N-acetyltransferase [Bacteroidales bacterium]
MVEVKFRKAEKKDTEKVLFFIKELAMYEIMADQVEATPEILEKNLFGPQPRAEVIFATESDREIGFVLFFHNFSTFLGKPGIYIEDLFVLPEYRGKGVGKALIAYIAGLAVERDCGRIEWWVLNWNPARRLYDGIGAESMDEWVVYRLSGDNLHKMAKRLPEIAG